MSEKHYVGELGTNIVIDLGEDISAAVNYKFYVKKPDGTLVEWTASLLTIDSQTNYLRHTAVTSDFDQSGEYELQPYLELGGWKGRGTTVKFTVYAYYS